MSKKPLYIVILAAGKGTRMKASLPKVLHPICGRPMIRYSLDLAKRLKAEKSFVVLGHGIETVRRHIGDGFSVVHQMQLKGTGDAVRRVLPNIPKKNSDILVLYGDMPLIRLETLRSLLNEHRKKTSKCTFLTAYLEDPASYGRILRDPRGDITAIIEARDATDSQKSIKEINTGVAVFDRRNLAEALSLVKPDNKKKELYLTDVVKMLAREGKKINSMFCLAEESIGINSQEELSSVHKLMQRRILGEYMRSGVRIVDPNNTHVNYGTKIGKDCVIYPFTVIENNVIIGNNCSVGPFCHLRESVKISDHTSVGNFIELVRTRVGKKTRIKHFGYIGDADIGNGVNIGAGCVVANFDGKNKNHTNIGNSVFVGSDSVLVAPVKLGNGAMTGAGAVVTKNSCVPPGAVVVGVPAKTLKKRSDGR